MQSANSGERWPITILLAMSHFSSLSTTGLSLKQNQKRKKKRKRKTKRRPLMPRKTLMDKVYEIQTETNRRHMREGTSKPSRDIAMDLQRGRLRQKFLKILDRYEETTSAQRPVGEKFRRKMLCQLS